MTLILIRKLLRDIWLPLLVVALLLGAFECLWARITQRITADLLPQLAKLIQQEQTELPFEPKDLLDLAEKEGWQLPLDRKELAGLLQQNKGQLPLDQKKMAAVFQKYKEKQGQRIAHDVQNLVFEGPGKIVQSLIGAEKLDLQQAQDTLSVGFVHPLVQVILCIWAIGRAAGAISGEIDRGTMELLLAQPVPRRSLVLAHLCVDALTIPILCLSLWIGVWLGAWLAGLLDNMAPQQLVYPLRFGPALLNVAALVFAVSGGTMFFSSLGRFRSRVLGLAVLFFLVQFLVNLIGQLWDDVAFLRPATVFYYYQPQFIILNAGWAAHGLVWLRLAALVAVGTTGYLLALWCFSRRDLPAPL